MRITQTVLLKAGQVHSVGQIMLAWGKQEHLLWPYTGNWAQNVMG